MSTKPKIYTFSFGNSNDGPVGGCIDVVAHSPEEALAHLQNDDPLPDHADIMSPNLDQRFFDNTGRVPRVNRITAYFTPENLTINDIENVYDL